MAIVIHDDVPFVDGVQDFEQSSALDIAVSQATAVLDPVTDIETRYRWMIEPLLPVLDAASATWMPPVMTLPPEFFSASASAALQAQLTASVAGVQAAVASITGPSLSLQSMSIASGTLETLRGVVGTAAVLPAIDYGITLPDMSWVAEAVLPTVRSGITMPDMSWLADAVLPAIDYGITLPDMSWVTDAVIPTLRPSFSMPDMSWSTITAPSSDSAAVSRGRERSTTDPDAAVDDWLSSIRSDLPSKRAGMRWALRHSPDAVCHAATSAVELFDHVLHELAPDPIVVTVSQDHSDPELFVRDTAYGPQLTWSGRARVAVMGLGGDTTAQDFAASFVDVRNQLVKMKHKSHVHGLRAAESALDRIDLLLRQLAVYK